jgi:hypothetical protein
MIRRWWTRYTRDNLEPGSADAIPGALTSISWSLGGESNS